MFVWTTAVLSLGLLVSQRRGMHLMDGYWEKKRGVDLVNITHVKCFSLFIVFFPSYKEI